MKPEDDKRTLNEKIKHQKSELLKRMTGYADELFQRNVPVSKKIGKADVRYQTIVALKECIEKDNPNIVKIEKQLEIAKQTNEEGISAARNLMRMVKKSGTLTKLDDISAAVNQYKILEKYEEIWSSKYKQQKDQYSPAYFVENDLPANINKLYTLMAEDIETCQNSDKVEQQKEIVDGIIVKKSIIKKHRDLFLESLPMPHLTIELLPITLGIDPKENKEDKLLDIFQSFNKLVTDINTDIRNLQEENQNLIFAIDNPRLNKSIVELEKESIAIQNEFKEMPNLIPDRIKKWRNDNKLGKVSDEEFCTFFDFWPKFYGTKTNSNAEVIEDLIQNRPKQSR